MNVKGVSFLIIMVSLVVWFTLTMLLSSLSLCALDEDELARRINLCNPFLAMQGGVLEVLLASAERLKNTNILGKSRYYVIIKCGNQEHMSKTASGEDGNVYWNEKHRFEFPNSDWQNLKHLILKIMTDEYLSDPDFVGETIVHLGGLITEGNARGHIELKPAPFNVLLEDDTYKGEIKIGFKFIPNVEVMQEKEEYCDKTREENQQKHWMERKIINFQRIPWRWLFFFYKRWRVPNRLYHLGRE